MDGLLVITIIVATITAFDVFALRWGADSRDIRVDIGQPARTAGLTVR